MRVTSQLESSMTIAAFKISTHETPELQAQATISTQDNVIFAQFIPTPALPDGQVSIDDFLTDLCADDPELTEAFSNGRKWGAAKFYGKEKSLRAIRLQAGFSQKKLAGLIGTSQSHIAKIETGKADPQLSTLNKLAKALNMTTENLVGAISE